MYFITKYLCCVLALLAATLTLAQAQIAPSSLGRQRAANRQALRDAHRTETPYDDSHLALTRQHLRRGGSESLPPVADEPHFGHNGTPHVAPHKFPGLRSRKPKAEPAP